MSRLNELRAKVGAISTQLAELDSMLVAGFPQKELIAMLAERSTDVENKVDAIEASTPAPKKNGNGKAKPEKTEKESKYVGKKIEYGGGHATIIGRSDNGFTARALTALSVDEKERKVGFEFDVSNTYVYRQLKGKKK